MPTTVTNRVSGSPSSTTTLRVTGSPTSYSTDRFPAYLLLSGDMTDGDDLLLLSGDMTDGDDVLLLSGDMIHSGIVSTTTTRVTGL